MSAFGDQLKQARLARSVALDAVASSTHIARRYLEALERSDLGGLPGGAFNTGYIRTYAQHLGIDPQPILEAYRREAQQHGQGAPEREQRMLHELSRLLDEKAERKTSSRFSSWGARLALAGLILGLVPAAAWFVIRNAASDRRASERLAIAEPSPPPEAGSSIAGLEAQEHPLQTGQTLRGSSATDSVTSKAPQALTAGLPPNDKARKPRLAVSEFRVGTNVVERRLTGDNDRFAEGTPVWFWTLVVGGQPGDVVRHVWSYQGRRIARSELTVGGPWWRTYSRFTLPAGSVGSWAVEAHGADGRLLARKEFLCLPSQQASQAR